MRGKRAVFLLIIVSVLTLISCNNKTIEEPESIELYPAYKKEGNQKKWGYLGNDGSFIIEPKFELTEEFNEKGLGKIYLEGKIGLIDKNGAIVLEPVYDAIGDMEEGVFSAVKGDRYYILDIMGNELFNSKEYVFLGVSSDQYIVAAEEDKDGNVKMGYINKNGKVLIEPKYSEAWNFKNNRALVKTENDQKLIIDKNGDIIKKLKYENVLPDDENKTFIFSDENNLFGYLDENGDILVEPRFKNAFHFKDGMAIVSFDDDSNDSGKWGVIDISGKFVLKPDFTYISYLGEGLFAVSKDKIEGSEIYAKKAIINKDGEQLTDFKYYNVGDKIENGYISVSDNKKTFFIDIEGKKVSDLPEIEGVGHITLKDSIIKASIDDRLSYYNKSGKVIWKEDNTYKLKDNILIKENKYNPTLGLSIYYPKLENLENKKVEEKINNQLYKLFINNMVDKVKEEEKNTTVKIDYKIKIYNDLLIVQKNCFNCKMIDEKIIPTEETYHIDLNTGNLYELKNLFKPNVNYVKRLTDIIRNEMEEKGGEGEYFLEEFSGIKEEQNFILFKDYLQLYFYPSEVGSHTDGFPRFNIPYEEINDILDTDSSFGKHLIIQKKGIKIPLIFYVHNWYNNIAERSEIYG